jgi:carbonic anhydrase
VVVLGLKNCPFVEAAVAGPTAPGHLRGIVREIRPAVLAVRKDAGEVLVNAVHENVYRMADRIARKAKFGEATPSVRIVRAVYDPDTGKVEFLN